MFQLVGAALGAGLSAWGASSRNKALSKAGSAEARMLAESKIDAISTRVEQSEQTKGFLTNLGGQTGPSPAGSNALNLKEMTAQLAGDAGLDVATVKSETKYRMTELANRIRSQGTNPIIAGFRGAMMGAQFGASLKGAFASKTPDTQGEE